MLKKYKIFGQAMFLIATFAYQPAFARYGHGDGGFALYILGFTALFGIFYFLGAVLTPKNREKDRLIAGALILILSSMGFLLIRHDSPFGYFIILMLGYLIFKGRQS